MSKPSTLSEYEQFVASWGERGPSHAVSESQLHYDRLTRNVIVLNVGVENAPRLRVPQGYVEAQKLRTFVTPPPSRVSQNG